MNSENNKSKDPDRVEKPVGPNPFAEGSPFSSSTVPPCSEEEPKVLNAGIWSIYNVQAEKHDKQLAERWIGQSRFTLHFAGLFSIVVSAFILGTDLLKPDSTELLLAQIYLQISGQIDAASLPVVQSIRPNSLAIAVHTLWSLSLLLSLASALGAILVQQWSQEYLRYSQCHPQPATRARIRAYLFDGGRNYRLEQVISALPLFLHLAIQLFCAGLVTYFFSLNKVVAYTSLAAYSIIGALYLLFTILPLIDLSSPFKTPMSTFLWRSLELTRLATLYALQWVTSVISLESNFFRFRLPKIIKARRERYRGGLVRALEQDLESVQPNVDAQALRWAVSSLGNDDDALESFIAGIPGFLASEPHSYPHFTIGHLLEDCDVRLGWSIGRLLQTCVIPSDTNDSILAPHVRNRRANACLRAVWSITEKFAGTNSLYWDTLFGAHTADALAALSRDDASPAIALLARCTAALAARSCLRELTHVAAWTRTKGPYWAHRARQLASLVGHLGALAPPPPALEVVERDGALLTLAAFLGAVSRGAAAAAADRSVAYMVSTTVIHLTDGVRAGDASLEAQRLFASEAFAVDVRGYWMHALDPAAARAVRLVAGSLHQEVATLIWKDLGAADASDFSMHQEDQGDGAGGNCRAAVGYSRWSYDSSNTAFSGDGTASGLMHRCSSQGDSPLGTVLEAPLLPNRGEHGV